MASEKIKGETEVSVFLRFLELSQLPIDRESIEKCFPPAPDILCTHQSEGAITFELVEMCDSLLAKSFAKESDAYVRTSDSVGKYNLEKVAKKLRN